MTEQRLIYVYRGSEYRERYGERCRLLGGDTVLARIEFADGRQMIVPRATVRRVKS